MFYNILKPCFIYNFYAEKNLKKHIYSFIAAKLYKLCVLTWNDGSAKIFL